MKKHNISWLVVLLAVKASKHFKKKLKIASVFPNFARDFLVYCTLYNETGNRTLSESRLLLLVVVGRAHGKITLGLNLFGSFIC